MLYFLHEELRDSGVSGGFLGRLLSDARLIISGSFAQNAGRGIAILFLFLLPFPASAAIAFGGISAVSTSQTPTSVAVSGSNTLCLDFVVGDTTGDDIAAVTWGGSSMTKIASVQDPSNRWMSTWYLAGCSSSAAISFTGGSFWRSYSFYYTGAKQTGQPDSHNTGTSLTTAITIATTVVAANSWYVMTQKDGEGVSTYTESGVLGALRIATDAGGIAIADSNGTVSTGSQSGTLTGTGSSDHGGIAFSIAPATAAVVSYPTEICLGEYCFFQ